MRSPAGEMPGFIRVDSQWTADAWRSAVRCRLGRFGAHSRVAPGLYALGRPDGASPVLVTANYRLSFDLLRRDMRGIDCWILVLDTRGLGVGSAAASGIFSTDELVIRVSASRLARVVSHRSLILPERASAVIDSGLVEKNTGFEVRIGPGRTSGISFFLWNKSSAVTVPRDIRVLDALAVTPVEVGRSLMWYPGFAFAAVLYAGLGPGGVTLGRAFAGSWPLLFLGLVSVLCGSLF
ncbi:MAG: mercury methylation corrinoid protein HgcA, partial [Spirochaetia bacterium]